MWDGDVGAEGSDTDVPSLSRAFNAGGSPPPPAPMVSEGLGMEALVLRAAGEDMVALDLWLGVWGLARCVPTFRQTMTIFLLLVLTALLTDFSSLKVA